MTARKFFYVCGGLALLMLSYHLGASTATAQSGTYFTVLGFPPTFVRVGGTIYYMDGLAHAWIQVPNGTYKLPPGVAASSLVVYNDNYAITSDGSGWFNVEAQGDNWAFCGHIPGGATNALQESWGSLKSRYAPSHGPTSQSPTNR